MAWRFGREQDSAGRRTGSPELAPPLSNAIIDAFHDWMWCVDANHIQLVAFNKSFADYYLRERGIWIEKGMSPEDLLPPEFALEWRGFFGRVLDEGPFSTEYQVYGTSRTLYLTFHAFAELGVICVVGRDITAEKALTEAVDTLRNFQSLLSDLAGRFVRAPVDGLAAVTSEAQARVCEHLDLDGSLLWEVVGGDPYFRLASACRLLPGPSWDQVSGGDDLPWTQQRLLGGNTVTFRTVDDLPEQAERDRETWGRLGIMSAVVLPMAPTGGRMTAALSFVMVSQPRAWSGHDMERLHAFAQLVADTRLRQHPRGQL